MQSLPTRLPQGCLMLDSTSMTRGLTFALKPLSYQLHRLASPGTCSRALTESYQAGEPLQNAPARGQFLRRAIS
jgi:hypothetical protein